MLRQSTAENPPTLPLPLHHKTDLLKDSDEQTLKNTTFKCETQQVVMLNLCRDHQHGQRGFYEFLTHRVTKVRFLLQI